MNLLLDALVVVVVVGAVAYLWRTRRGCGACQPRRAGGETRIALDKLRDRARQAAGRR